MTTVSMAKKDILLHTDSEFSASHTMNALTTGQWVRVVKGGIQIADIGPDPKMSDHERLIAGAVAPCFTIPDGVKTSVVQRMPPKDGEPDNCYVQHIGAGIPNRNYERLYNMMVSVGFILLRSPKSAEGEHWEIWYLPGLWALNEPLKGADRRKLVAWLFDNVAPGNVEFTGEAWALSWE